MRVAVTGGSGQLGGLVLRRLADERSITGIVAIDLRPPLVASSKIEALRLDIRDKDLAHRLRGCDVLVHLAFLVAKRGKREEQDSVNVGGSENVFRQAIAAGIRRVLYASSVAQYGVVPTLPTPVIEETLRTRQPDFWYACAKHDVERRLDELERAHPDLRVVRFRPAILIGRRMENLLGQLLRKGLMPDSGSLPIVWDEDVADAFILALRTGARGAYNLSADDQQQPRELARVAGLRVPKISVGVVRAAEKLLTRLRLIKPGDPGWTMPVKMRLVYSSEKAKRELGWRPKYPTARDVMKHFVEVAPRTLDKRLSALTRMINLSEPVPGRGLESAVHLELTGPNGGDLTLRAQGGKLHISRGAPRPADATVTLKADTLLDLLAGKLDYAGAQLDGRVQLEGQGHGGLLLGGVIEGFRAAARQRGAARRLARKMGR
ncbi:MAG TPA: NAD-dependent epimerase/dehydratase family protein [Myxococcales bacterium]|nr:NAD-dependent epimerase/dehydratase family protein [Myxococcales bacterium]